MYVTERWAILQRVGWDSESVHYRICPGRLYRSEAAARAGALRLRACWAAQVWAGSLSPVALGYLEAAHLIVHIPAGATPQLALDSIGPEPDGRRRLHR